jgi:hypothetical protein
VRSKVDPSKMSIGDNDSRVVILRLLPEVQGSFICFGSHKEPHSQGTLRTIFAPQRQILAMFASRGGVAGQIWRTVVRVLVPLRTDLYSKTRLRFG